MASLTSVKVRAAAVGIPARAMTCLAYALEASSWAPSRDGPHVRILAAINESTTPAARGASGPTTTRSTRLSRARAVTASALVMSNPVTTGSKSPRPGLPGR